MVIITIFSHRYKKRRLLIVFTRKTLRPLASLFFSVHRRILLNDFPQWPIEKRRVILWNELALRIHATIRARKNGTTERKQKIHVAELVSIFHGDISALSPLFLSLLLTTECKMYVAVLHTQGVVTYTLEKPYYKYTRASLRLVFRVTLKISLVSASRLKSSIADLKKKRCFLFDIYSLRFDSATLLRFYGSTIKNKLRIIIENIDHDWGENFQSISLRWCEELCREDYT